MTTEPERESIRDLTTRLGITANALRITREAFSLANPGNDFDEAQRDRTYWLVTLNREGARELAVPYSLGSSAWWATRGAVSHRREGQGFGARCRSCFEAWPCAETLRRSWISGSPDSVPAAPGAADVLDSMLSDASSYENARDFADWCGEYGYDTDSRRAERTYNAVAEQTKQVRAFLGADWSAFLECEGL
jgi:hypothetical protein